MINEKGERALAHIEKIEWVKPIDGADNIEMVGVLGWHCIAKKEEFKEGDLCVYIEIDSKVPEDNIIFEFLASKKYKVKTMKLGKFCFNGGFCISQGLAMPITSFTLSTNEIGKDVTKELGITYAVEEDIQRKADANPEQKYKSMAERHSKIFKNKWMRRIMRYKWGRRILFLFFGKKKDNPLSFPKHFPYIHKTDEERIENMPWILKNKNPLIKTEKIDGTSTTFILERKGRKKYEFYVVSRNIRQVKPEQACYHDYNIYWEMAKKYNIEAILKDILYCNRSLKYVCIQGESVGKVQGNKLKLVEDDFYAYNFITSDIGRWNSIAAKDYLAQYGIKWVPIIDENYILPDTIEEMKIDSTGPSYINPEVLREGFVYRSKEDNTISFKNVSPEFLLKHKE